MASHDGASSSSSSNISSFTHDVFLSFRGPDTGDSFTAFLHKHLVKEGVDVYIDREDLRPGEEIKSALFKAIQVSKISIPVFSKGYADSRWCLDELVEIVRCHRDNGQIILPIFFDVDPKDVRRHQTGSFKTSFEKHKDRFEEQTINSWKEALEEVSDISGYDLGKVTGNQSKLVDLVVERVLSESSGKRLDDVKYPVGLDTRVKEVEDRLCIGSDDVQFVGLWGTGGIGKTTIAKTLYNRIFKNFRRSCFLADIKGEEASGPKGLVHLQEQLIYSISKWKVDGNIGNIYRGRQLIIEKLQGENVLLILDDVDSRSQLDALAIECNWFGPASRIVITSRDKHILELAKVDEDKIYCPEDLDDEQSLHLFSLHAFSSHQPPEEYLQLSLDVTNLAGGLPLTLEVLGSTFSDKENREEEVWKCMLQELKRIPHDDVYKKLKISYDNLKGHEKSIFLDAACFFVGMRKEKLIPIWDACGFNPISTIKKLTQRSLLKFETLDYGGFSTRKEDYGEIKYDVLRLRMHDQIQSMGRRIVNDENPMEPSKRSRLRSPDEVLEAIEDPEGAQMLEVIHRDAHCPSSKEIYMEDCCLSIIHQHRRDFSRMSKLRVLNSNGLPAKCGFLCPPPHLRWKGNGPHAGGDFPHLPPNLRWFKWNGLIVPANFYHKKLVHMDLSRSQIRGAWTNKPQNENQHFQKLKVLLLKNCDVSYESLDFLWFPYLETLDLQGCKNMVNLHKSIGDLKSLVELNLGQTNIEELPNSICSLSSLKFLSLRCCSSLKNLPKSIGDLRALVKLDLEGTKIDEIPSSINKLSCLEVLILDGCSSLMNLPDPKLDLGETKIEEITRSISKLKKASDGVSLLEKLEELRVRSCHNLIKLPISLGRMRCLRIIDLIGTRILISQDDSVIMLPSLVVLRIGNNLESSLPPWISGLPRLRHLQLEGYTKLESIPDLPSTLTTLDVSDCNSLQTLPDLSSLKHLWSLKLTGCEELKEIPGFEGTESLKKFWVHYCKNLTNTGRWKIHGQGRLLVDRMEMGSNNGNYTSNGNDGIDKELILCVVFKFYKDKDVREGQLVDVSLLITAEISSRKHGRINDVRHRVLIEGVEYSSKRDIIYLHHFKGFDWFGIPLEPGIDAIKLELVFVTKDPCLPAKTSPFYSIDCDAKFWKVFEQQQQQITNQEEESSTTTTTIARRMVADFFNWSNNDESIDEINEESSDEMNYESSDEMTDSHNDPIQADDERTDEMIDSRNDPIQADDERSEERIPIMLRCWAWICP